MLAYAASVAVDVGVADLVRNYVHLRDAADGSSAPSMHLLLFYAVECGLKAAVLGKNGMSARGTESLPDELRNHDLRKLAKRLRIDSSTIGEFYSCRRKHDLTTTVAYHDLHQAWRYGASLNHDDERRATSVLENLSGWCKKEHGR